MLSTLACTADPDGKSPQDTPAADHSSTSDTQDGPTTATGATASTGHTGETEPTGPMPWELSTFDCASLPATPVVGDRLNWVPSAEDYTFSPDGFQWGVSAGILKKTPYGGPPQLVVPGLGDVRGTRFLPDGRLAMSHPEDGSVWIVDPATGSSAPIAGGFDTPNGLAIDFEGRISVATQERIVRIDPATGDTEVLVQWPNKSFDGITYSPDFTRLYFNEELGRVHWIDFAPDGTWSEPDEGIQLVQNPLLGFSILDGMAVDVCGNLYAGEMNGQIWRIRADDHSVDMVANIGGASIVPAINFGLPATGGWQADHLYAMDFLGALIDLPVGIPGKWEPHLPWPTP